MPELRLKKESTMQEPNDQGKVQIGSTSNLIARLREVETEYETPGDLRDLRSEVVAALKNYEETNVVAEESRYRLGEALYRYHAALPYGAWMMAVRVIAKFRNRTDRAIREIVADYARVERVPADLIAELESAEIDPAAKKNAKVVQMAQQGHAEGQSATQAVKAAMAARRPVASERSPRVPMTQDERWVQEECDWMLKGLDCVPENRKLDILGIAVAKAIGYLTPSRDPIIIVPIEPTGDMSGKKKPPKRTAPNKPNKAEGQAGG
jgi:hypothetical protein